MAVSRREFFGRTAAAGLVGLVRLDGHEEQPVPSARKVFRHGVASGDPLSDRVILWTRVTAPEGTTPEVQWEIAADNGFKRVVARGAAETAWERDFTVKIDASGLRPATTYYYRFQALGERSPIGRTRTLPGSGTGHLRLALASCSNFPFGYFNVYNASPSAPISTPCCTSATTCMNTPTPPTAMAPRGPNLRSEPRDRLDRRLPAAPCAVQERSGSAGGASPASVDHRLGRSRSRQQHVAGGAENHHPDRGEGGCTRGATRPSRPISSGCRFANTARRASRASIARFPSAIWRI